MSSFSKKQNCHLCLIFGLCEKAKENGKDKKGEKVLHQPPLERESNDIEGMPLTWHLFQEIKGEHIFFFQKEEKKGRQR